MGTLRRIAAAVAGALIMVACGGQNTASDTSPIKVGLLTPLSGTFAANGKNYQNGFTLGLKHFGDKVNGRKIDALFVDTQGDPNVALTVARRLIENDKIDVLEGPLAANEIAAVAGYAAPLGVPLDDISLCAAVQIQKYKKFQNAYS